MEKRKSSKRFVIASAATVALFFVSAQASAAEQTCRVVKVSDGDTLTVLCAGNAQVKVRLAEIDAPEKKQAFGERSRQSLAQLCAGKDANVASSKLDRYGRTLGIVTCDGIEANAEQIRRGLA